jgi:hypothetical protein
MSPQNRLPLRPSAQRRTRPRSKWDQARFLAAAAGLWALPHAALGADPPPAGGPASDVQSSDLLRTSDQAPVNLDPMIVRAPTMPGFLGKIFGFSWNVSELTGQSNFHIRRGELVDAIGFRHLYLQKHPQERAIVVVVMVPPDGRVTQAAVAYTAGPVLHLESAALGDLRPSGLTAEDLDHPERIQKYMQQVRESYLQESDSEIQENGLDQEAIDRATGGRKLVPTGVQLAQAEETGNYSGVTIFGGEPVYRGSAADMLVSAFYWLNNESKVGLIPVARSKVNLFVTVPRRRRGGSTIRTEVVDGVVFDWDGVHYFYTDQSGTLGLPFPKNPLTGAPYLVVQQGDLLESLFFLATYAKQHPGEATAPIAAEGGAPAAGAFTRGGRVWLFSPFLGKFAMLPERFKIDQRGALASVHRALIARGAKRKDSAGRPERPTTGVPQTMPGDSLNEQVRRAYLAFQDAGTPVKFVENARRVPGLEVHFHNTDYIYLAPVAAANGGPAE